ncbi:chromosome segregation ATPase [Streptomyces sp. PvR006]|uniref:hypothetical protein n=1 Tax=Streptomyces sp. PvR006 TaxID=2817860 RepID=UPI001AE80095|nr:hypothetical protein [Streptomyces sp. PvR006]MBP2583007.1 chromosome segregation ATPase [Streptomyces sp. PvR006]
MSNRHSATRTARTRDRAARRDTLLVLLDRLDRLSEAEATLLREYMDAELAASDALRSTLVGLERALQEEQDRTRAAEAAIVETETERDTLGHYLNAVRRELGGTVPWPDLPHAVRQLAAERPTTARNHPEEP